MYQALKIQSHHFTQMKLNKMITNENITNHFKYLESQVWVALKRLETGPDRVWESEQAFLKKEGWGFHRRESRC